MASPLTTKAASVAKPRRWRSFLTFSNFIFPKLKLALFIDGCFWHSCPAHGTRPASNRPFWDQKLQRNRSRDQKVRRHLRARGWHVARIWEHDLKPKNLPALTKKLHRLLAK